MEHNPHNSDQAMTPFLPDELFIAAVELVCYFCTAVGVALTWFLAPR